MSVEVNKYVFVKLTGIIYGLICLMCSSDDWQLRLFDLWYVILVKQDDDKKLCTSDKQKLKDDLYVDFYGHKNIPYASCSPTLGTNPLILNYF